MERRQVEPFLHALVATPEMQNLWYVRNGGLALFVHTIDVAMLALDAFDEWQEQNGRLDLLSTLVGALLHDLTKVTARETKGQPGHRSHSEIMLFDPQAAAVEAANALRAARRLTGALLGPEQEQLVSHIIMSHHGPWGSVPPRSPEARLVHHCDLYSARFHRQPTVDANDILALLDNGMSKAQAARTLSVTPQLIRKRLEEACRAEWLDSPDELLVAWRVRGHIMAGSEEAQKQRAEIRLRVQQAETAPACLIGHATFTAWLDAYHEDS